jgi:GT2 family glycosyltransferase
MEGPSQRAGGGRPAPLSPPPKPTDASWAEGVEELFYSPNATDVFRFLERAPTVTDLVAWMKARPAAALRTVEIEGDRTIVAVVPTPDVDGAGAQVAREMYRGHTVIFVESSGKRFNYARSCNAGLASALRYAPDWVILANDDLYPIDPFPALTSALSAIDPRSVRTVFLHPPGGYYSHQKVVGLRTWRTSLPRRWGLGYGARYERCCERLGVKFEVWEHRTLSERGKGRLFLAAPRTVFWNMTSFGVLSGPFLREVSGHLFDEGYLNGFEDVDLCLRLKPNAYRFVDFRLGAHQGRSLGTEMARSARDVANLAYFNEKLRTDEELRTRVLGR